MVLEVVMQLLNGEYDYQTHRFNKGVSFLPVYQHSAKVILFLSVFWAYKAPRECSSSLYITPRVTGLANPGGLVSYALIMSSAVWKCSSHSNGIVLLHKSEEGLAPPI